MMMILYEYMLDIASVLPLTSAIGMCVVDGSWDDGIAERLRAWNQQKALLREWPAVAGVREPRNTRGGAAP